MKQQKWFEASIVFAAGRLFFCEKYLLTFDFRPYLAMDAMVSKCCVRAWVCVCVCVCVL